MEKYVNYFITLRITSLQNGKPESGQCWRHCNVMVDHFHIYWHCPLIQPPLLHVTKEMTSILKIKTNIIFKLYTVAIYQLI